MKRRMQRNLVLLFVGSSVIPLGLVAAIGYYSSHRSIVSMVEERTSFSCAEIEQRFTDRLRNIEDQFLLVARGAGTLPVGWSTRVRENGGRVEFYLDDLLFEAGLELIFTRFVILDANGAPRYRIDYGSQPQRGNRLPGYYLQTSGFTDDDRRGFELAAELGPAESRQLLPGPDAPIMTVRFVAALAGKGQRLGVMLADFDAGGLLETLGSDMSMRKDAFWFLIDTRTRVVLSHPEYPKRGQLLSVALPRLPPDFLQQDSSGSLRFVDGQSRRWILAYRRLPGTPWVVAVAGPLENALAPIERVGSLNLVLVLVVLTATAVLIAIATRRFRGSLSSLTTAAEGFSAGDLERRIPVRSDDEMGALSDAFNRMADQLRRHIDEREHNARFESFNRLSAAVAHDLKSSLFSLSLLVDNLDRHKDDPEFLRDSALTIHNTLEKIKKTGEKLSLGERSLTAPQRARLDLAPLLRRVIDASGVESHSGIVLKSSLDESACCLGDDTEIERLATNLLQNAIEAMTEGGELGLSCRSLHDGICEIVVEDSGVGMTPEFLRDRLFRPFNSTKERGIGLGLYSCKEIVDRHDGTIDVDSAPGRGTRITVRLSGATVQDGAGR